ncbi:MAG TPA: response regulator, partial [Polyangiaceae bacterium]|nr:response regulator [Polyangiaceae bacterium]
MTERSAQVLLIDGDDGPRRAARWYLSRAGFEVAAFGSSEEARRAVGGGKFFDVVVSDLRIRGTDGAALLRACRALNARVPLVMITGDTSNRTANIVAEQGALLCLAKPVDLDELVDAVQEATLVARQRERD